MNLTKQQALVLFDIAKSCLYDDRQNFGGYDKNDIGRLLNNIISQQDDTTIIQFIDDPENDEFWENN